MRWVCALYSINNNRKKRDYRNWKCVIPIKVAYSTRARCVRAHSFIQFILWISCNGTHRQFTTIDWCSMEEMHEPNGFVCFVDAFRSRRITMRHSVCRWLELSLLTGFRCAFGHVIFVKQHSLKIDRRGTHWSTPKHNSTSQSLTPQQVAFFLSSNTLQFRSHFLSVINSPVAHFISLIHKIYSSIENKHEF